MAPPAEMKEDTLGWFLWWWWWPVEPGGGLTGRRGEKCVDGIWPTVCRLTEAVPKMFLTDVRPAMDVVRGATATEVGGEIVVFTFTGGLE